MPSSLNFVVKIQILNSERSWADDGHIALENVDQFGQLVQRGAAQKSAVLIEPDIVGKQISLFIPCVAHCAEFYQIENFLFAILPFSARSWLNKKRIALHCEGAHER